MKVLHDYVLIKPEREYEEAEVKDHRWSRTRTVSVEIDCKYVVVGVGPGRRIEGEFVKPHVKVGDYVEATGIYGLVGTNRLYRDGDIVLIREEE